MHQGGGTTKKLLMWLTTGPKRSGNEDARIKYVNKHLPRVFEKKMKPTTELPDYNFTELCQFLLYTGKLLLFALTANHFQYDNFLKLSVACYFMCDADKASSYEENPKPHE